mmetsp:Transcript_75370/g.189610  ORF Transcript_75370/g.189610 Transcript_75370/m.189610 type:complete len:205 (+) Transcript_75370:93-707(+)
MPPLPRLGVVAATLPTADMWNIADDFRSMGRCAFCTNMRATDCALRACALCCVGNQGLYGIRCLRHVPDLLEEWSESTASAGLSEESTLLSSDVFGGSMLGEVLLDDRCAFCNNRRAADCIFSACRSCCLARPERCERHMPQVRPSPPVSMAAVFERSARTGEDCQFCANQRAAGCAQNACRRCCLATMMPCDRHLTRGAQTSL